MWDGNVTPSLRYTWPCSTHWPHADTSKPGSSKMKGVAMYVQSEDAPK